MRGLQPRRLPKSAVAAAEHHARPGGEMGTAPATMSCTISQEPHGRYSRRAAERQWHRSVGA